MPDNNKAVSWNPRLGGSGAWQPSTSCSGSGKDWWLFIIIPSSIIVLTLRCWVLIENPCLPRWLYWTIKVPLYPLVFLSFLNIPCLLAYIPMIIFLYYQCAKNLLFGRIYYSQILLLILCLLQTVFYINHSKHIWTEGGFLYTQIIDGLLWVFHFLLAYIVFKRIDD
jgi:hypothetical protein